MTATELRVGRISTVNAASGTARVVYADQDNAVSAEIPLLALEYQLPQAGQLVFVLAAGQRQVILGRVWNAVNRPPEGGEGLYRKDLDATAGRAVLRYDAATGVLLMHAPVLRFTETQGGGEASLGELLRRIVSLENRVAALEERMDAAEAWLRTHDREIAANAQALAAQDARITALGG